MGLTEAPHCKARAQELWVKVKKLWYQLADFQDLKPCMRSETLCSNITLIHTSNEPMINMAGTQESVFPKKWHERALWTCYSIRITRMLVSIIFYLPSCAALLALSGKPSASQPFLEDIWPSRPLVQASRCSTYLHGPWVRMKMGIPSSHI